MTTTSLVLLVVLVSIVLIIVTYYGSTLIGIYRDSFTHKSGNLTSYCIPVRVGDIEANRSKHLE